MRTNFSYLEYFKTFRKPTILLFDKDSRHLHRFEFKNKSMTKMHSYPYDVSVHCSVTFDEYIYVFDFVNKSNYRLEYCDVTATWERMSWPDGIETEWAPLVTASSNAIFLVGRRFDRFVFKYNPPLDRWERLPEVDICWSVVYGNGFLYCIIGFGESGRLNLETLKWEKLADRNIRNGYELVAVECGGDIYVINRVPFRNESVQSDIVIEKYDPNVDKWTELKPLTIDGFSIITNAFAIHGDLYIVRETQILKYDVKNTTTAF